MGMEQFIRFAGPAPSWQAIRRQVVMGGLKVELRMIDGLPAFPDELPEHGWRELRISTPGGMITLRLQLGGLSLIVFATADEQLERDRDKVAQAFSAAIGTTE